jgi:carboxymethylenebutenolidase
MATPFRTVLPLDTPAYASLPEGAQRGVVVLHEIYGPQPEIERVVDRFAGAGYAAVMPDLFSKGPKLVCIARAIAATATGRGEQIDQIRAAAEWLSERSGVSRDRIGVIGFCMGGGFALATGSGFSAVSTNYGEVPPTEVMRGTGPVIGCYGGRDRVFGKHARKLESRLRPLGVEVETHTFDSVGHSFLTDGDHPVGKWLSQPILRVSYDAAVAEDAWSRIFAFFERHLGTE